MSREAGSLLVTRWFEHYLHDKKSNLGIFVLILLSFGEVRQVSTKMAAELTEASVDKKHAEVIVFECLSGHSPRNATNRTRKKWVRIDDLRVCGPG
jgi:hypothetical protein